MLDLLLIAHDGADAGAFADALASRLRCKLGWTTLDATEVPRARWAWPLLLHEGVHLREDAPRVAAQAGARLLPALAPNKIAQLVVDGVERAFGRRLSAVFVVRDWIAAEALVAELYAASRRFSHAALAAFDAPPGLGQLLAELAEDGVKRCVVQAIAVFAGRWQRHLAAAAASAPFAIKQMPPLAEQAAFVELVAQHIQTQWEADDGDSDRAV